MFGEFGRKPAACRSNSLQARIADSNSTNAVSFQLFTRTRVLRRPKSNRACEMGLRLKQGVPSVHQRLPSCSLFGQTSPYQTMKKLIWLLPLLIILGAVFVAVEM